MLKFLWYCSFFGMACIVTLVIILYVGHGRPIKCTFEEFSNAIKNSKEYDDSTIFKMFRDLDSKDDDEFHIIV